MDILEFDNKMELKFSAKSANESFARVAIAAFISQLNPTIAEVTEVKTAVSEAVTNAIIHGYDSDINQQVFLSCFLTGNSAEIIIKDLGQGIEDINLAREALYTSKPEMERSGMGFTIMEEFMDAVEIISKPNEGTTIIMTKNFEQNKEKLI